MHLSASRDLLRRVLLAVCVLEDLDLRVGEFGARVDDLIDLDWDEVGLALAPNTDDSAAAVAAVRHWVRTRVQLARLDAGPRLARMRPVALPLGHLLHPGPFWAAERVLGGSLDVGIGVSTHGGVTVLDPRLLACAGIDAEEAWDRARRYRTEMASFAVAHHARSPLSTLRSVGDCDVPTLLSAPEFRSALTDVDPSGMRSAAVPTRWRGWLDLGRVDPAFAVVAASTVPDADRGFPRALLLTRDEVVLVPAGGDHSLLLAELHS